VHKPKLKKTTNYVRCYSNTSKSSNSSSGGSGRGSGGSRVAPRCIPRNMSTPSLSSYHTKDNDDRVIGSVQDRPLTAELNSKMPPDDVTITSTRYRQNSDETFAGVDPSRKIYTVYSAKESKEERRGPVYNTYCAKEVKNTRGSEGDAGCGDSNLVLPISRSGSAGKASFLRPNMRPGLSNRTSFDSLEEESPGLGLDFDDNSDASVIALGDESQGWDLHFDRDDLNTIGDESDGKISFVF